MKHLGREREQERAAAPEAGRVAEEPVECASSPCMMAQFPELTAAAAGSSSQEIKKPAIKK